MRIGYLTHTLNPRTGAGVFSNALIDGVRTALPKSSLVVLTSEDLLIPKKFSLLFQLGKIRAALRDCDVIHALDGFPYGVIAAVANRTLRKPLIITAVGTGAIQKLNHPLYGRVLRWAYMQASLITAPSKYIAKELSRALPGIEVMVINHGVNLDHWKEAGNVLPGGVTKPYILSVGAIKRRKGYHVSLRAFALARKKHTNLQYVIVGNPAQSPDYFRELTQIISEEELGDSVRFVHGVSLPVLGALYAKAELFLLLPQNIAGDVEGFGLVFLEAASAGLPVVASSGTAAEDAVHDGTSGVLVPGDSPKEVAAAITKIISNGGERGRLAKGAKQFAESMTWQQQIDHYVEEYKRFQS